MREYFVYILQCADGSYYVGVTNNLESRVEQHNNGETVGYTTSRRPCVLVYSERFSNPVDAIAAEKQLKGWSRKKKAALIAGRVDMLPMLAASQSKLSAMLRQAQHDNLDEEYL